MFLHRIHIGQNIGRRPSLDGRRIVHVVSAELQQRGIANGATFLHGRGVYEGDHEYVTVVEVLTAEPKVTEIEAMVRALCVEFKQNAILHTSHKVRGRLITAPKE